MALALGVDDLEEHARAIDELVHTRAPSSARELAQLASKLPELAHVPPRSVSTRPRCQEVVMRPGTRSNLDALPILTCWPDGRRPLHHAPAGHHARSRDAAPATSGCYRMQKLDRRTHRHALADPQDRRAPLPPGEGARRCRGSRSPSRSAAIPALDVRRDRAAARRDRRVDVRRASCASAPSTTVTLQDGRPRGPGRRGLRPRGVRRPARGARRRGAVRRSHGVLHAGRPLPALSRDRAHPPRPTPSTRRRSSARRRWRTPGSARPPSGSSCRSCGCSSPRSWT